MVTIDKTTWVIIGTLILGLALIYGTGGAVSFLDIGWALFGGAIFLFVWHLISDVVPARKRRHR